ncbi:MAG: RhuM family protein [Bacilli bacterium]|jgi:prophage maintenance system killer protein
MKNELVIFENQKVKLEVNVKDDTVWLNSEQIAELFNRDYKTIRKHINNALKEELDEKVVVAKFASTTIHGAIKGKSQTKMIDYYNLDMIISVGYRVKSKNGIIFRQWANKVLKEYLLKGYAADQNRLEYLEKKVQLIDIAGRIDANLTGDEAKDIIRVINNYKEAFDLLDDYDHKKIIKPRGLSDDKRITYDECIKIINKLKFNNNSNIFALERDRGLEAIIGNIYQTFDGEDVYKTIEEKAANFLYLIIKNHVFIDGNKRIAATLFIYFLEFYNILYYKGKEVIDNNTLVAITLLTAKSNPNEKNILVDLIMNFLKRGDAIE